MAIQIKVIKKIMSKGKKYQSLEEMPDDIRPAIEKAMINDDVTSQPNTETKIVVNGKEYDSMDNMPPDIRELYENAVRALRARCMTHDEVSLAGEGMWGNLHKEAISYSGPGPIEPQSSFSSFPGWLILGAALLVLITGLYFLFAVW